MDLVKGLYRIQGRVFINLFHNLYDMKLIKNLKLRNDPRNILSPWMVTFNHPPTYSSFYKKEEYKHKYYCHNEKDAMKLYNFIKKHS